MSKNNGSIDKEEMADTYRTYIRTSAVGLEVGLSIVVGVIGGYWADKYWEISPYGLLVGSLIGCLAAIRRLYGFSKKYLKEQQKEESKHE